MARPLSMSDLFPQIIGQELPKKILTFLYKSRHFPPLLFVGPEGVGKRTTAITYAQLINCPDPNDWGKYECVRCRQIAQLNNFDTKLFFPIGVRKTSLSAMQAFENIDLSNPFELAKYEDVLAVINKNLSSFCLGQIRPRLSSVSYHPLSIIQFIKTEMAFRPVVCKYKVIIILDAHKMRAEAANALLKTLEEPQKDTVFILTAEQITQIVPTIRSRCQVVYFRYLTKDEIKNYLLNKKIPEEKAEVASLVAEGSLRKALTFINNEGEFWPSSEIITLIDRSQSSAQDFIAKILNNETLSNDVSLEKTVSSLIYLYRQALFAKLNMPIILEKSTINRIVEKLNYEQILLRLTWLLKAETELSMNLNRKIFLFKILATLRI
jgi:DNA polymerase-3 subunit delta'